MARKSKAAVFGLRPCTIDFFSWTHCAMSPDAIFSIAVWPRWVSLFFLQGAGLLDPNRLLKGSGKVARHLVLEDAADLDRPAVQELIRARRPVDLRALADAGTSLDSLVALSAER